jgi:2-keto-3-deoxy-L-fuconate dehydrogenase
MNGRLAGKVAFVTAAGQGIGRATAVASSDAGARVCATDINDALLALLSQKRPNIQTRPLDVREMQDIENCAVELGTPDALFNGAGYVPHGT